jgi:glutaredoxin
MAHLSERGIAFDEKDITADPAYVHELVGTYQSRSTPTIVVGDEVMVGFDPERLNQMLGS